MENTFDLVQSLQLRLHETLEELRSLEYSKQCTCKRYQELVQQESQIRLELDSAWKALNSD